MAKDNGGIIGVLNTPTTSSASGVWAIEDQYQAQRNGYLAIDTLFNRFFSYSWRWRRWWCRSRFRWRSWRI
jgi:hypothetical protein